MINSIFENLFEPNTPEEVAARKPKPLYEIGDEVVLRYDQMDTNMPKNSVFGVEEVHWRPDIGDYNYWCRDVITHRTFVYNTENMKIKMKRRP